MRFFCSPFPSDDKVKALPRHLTYRTSLVELICPRCLCEKDGSLRSSDFIGFLPGIDPTSSDRSTSSRPSETSTRACGRGLGRSLDARRDSHPRHVHRIQSGRPCSFRGCAQGRSGPSPFRHDWLPTAHASANNLRASRSRRCSVCFSGGSRRAETARGAAEVRLPVVGPPHDLHGEDGDPEGRELSSKGGLPQAQSRGGPPNLSTSFGAFLRSLCCCRSLRLLLFPTSPAFRFVAPSLLFSLRTFPTE